MVNRVPGLHQQGMDAVIKPNHLWNFGTSTLALGKVCVRKRGILNWQLDQGVRQLRNEDQLQALPGQINNMLDENLQAVLADIQSTLTSPRKLGRVGDQKAPLKITKTCHDGPAWPETRAAKRKQATHTLRDPAQDHAETTGRSIEKPPLKVRHVQGWAADGLRPEEGNCPGRRYSPTPSTT
ncbi:hypothetical protein FN846DRAFT_994622 [Sphaerosporella brunnea]|uniref:Uncharacterized protein n=1 Tax=Sphaerosporella brunnea TaxID=1250544 RepID=A0A5J5F778_9PEZI|nr:hypothetical protein FN846DRAFT_994622 [Sphaerosporella brunnea]